MRLRSVKIGNETVHISFPKKYFDIVSFDFSIFREEESFSRENDFIKSLLIFETQSTKIGIKRSHDEIEGDSKSEFEQINKVARIDNILPSDPMNDEANKNTEIISPNPVGNNNLIQNQTSQNYPNYYWDSQNNCWNYQNNYWDPRPNISSQTATNTYSNNLNSGFS